MVLAELRALRLGFPVILIELKSEIMKFNFHVNKSSVNPIPFTD